MGNFRGATVWTGSALNCPSDEIVLTHRSFTRNNLHGKMRTCNNGSTVAQSLFVRNNLYISQLNITVTQNAVGKTITCIYDDREDGTVNQSQFSIQIRGIIRVCTFYWYFVARKTYSGVERTLVIQKKTNIKCKWTLSVVQLVLCFFFMVS